MSITCSEDIIQFGEIVLNSFLKQIIVGALRCPERPGLNDPPCDPNRGEIIYNLLYNAITTVKCKLPKDLVNQITNESSSVVSKVNLLYVIVIFSTLIILMIFIYLAIAFPDTVLIFAILSIVMIILNAIILLVGLNSIYKQSNDTISLLLTDVKDAIDSGFCCLGSCAKGQCLCLTCLN